MVKKRIQLENFEGFYCSLLMDDDHTADEITEEVRYINEQRKENGLLIIPDNMISNLDSFYVDYKEMRLDISKRYLILLEQYLLQEKDIELDIEFLELNSPNFYNYRTDWLIFNVSIDKENRAKIYKLIREQTNIGWSHEWKNFNDIFNNFFKILQNADNFYSSFTGYYLENSEIYASSYIQIEFDELVKTPLNKLVERYPYLKD